MQPDLSAIVDAAIARQLAEEGAAQAARAFREKPRAAGRGSATDLRVCRHEAAHAVVGWLIGGSPLVNVVVRDDLSGEMTNAATARAAETPPGEDHTDRLAAMRADHPAVLRVVCAKHICTVLAGITADAHGGYHRWTGAIDDLVQADRLAELAVGRGERGRFLVPLREITTMGVHDTWPWIVELADWLQRERTLAGPEVEAWLAAHDRDGVRAYYGRSFAETEPKA